MKSLVVKVASTLAIGLGACVAPLVSLAQPYQIEASANLSLVSRDFNGFGSSSGNIINFGARYYLAPVETVGPWGQSAFLQKSSSAGARLFRTGGDFRSSTDFTFDLFYVTEDDLIVGGELSSSDDTDIAVFGGIYLDDRSTAIARIGLGGLDSISGRYKTMIQLGSGNNVVAEAGVALVSAFNSGISVDGAATYYLSDQLGVSGGLSLETFGNEELTLAGGAEYFLSETLAANGRLSFAFGDSSDSTSIVIGVLGRF